nr:TfoX/Sxy family protein [Janibacter alkaliphilus]
MLADEPGLTERRMFGGLGFMLDGHMAVAADSKGGLMVRHDPADDSPDPLLAPTVMRGGPIRGWSDIDPEVALGDDELARLVRIGVGYVRGLPPKG